MHSAATWGKCVFDRSEACFRKQLAKNAVSISVRRDCLGKDIESLIGLLAERNGKPLNAAAIGRQFGFSQTTAMAWVKDLAHQGFVRLIPSFEAVRRPLLFLPESFLGSCVEAVITTLTDVAPGSRFFWWKTGRVRQIPVLAETGQRRLGFCFCAFRVPQKRDWWPLRLACQRGLIQRGYLLHTGSRAFAVNPSIFGLPFAAFLSEPEDWINHRTTIKEASAVLARINRSASAIPSSLSSGT